MYRVRGLIRHTNMEASMAKSLKQEVKDSITRWLTKINQAPEANRAAIKATAKAALMPYLDACNMKRWQGRQVADLVWHAVDYIDRM
jgi:hypothetical protein